MRGRVTKKPSRGPRRANSGSFKPGQSGNPSGARKIPPDLRAAFAEASPKAVQTLFDALDHAPWPVRVAAAREIFDRHLGRPRQAVEVTGANKGPVQTITSSMTQAEAAHAYALTVMATAEQPVEPNGHDATPEAGES
jgi:hypothetical protein